MTLATIPTNQNAKYQDIARQEKIFSFYQSWSQIVAKKELELHSFKADTVGKRVLQALDVKQLVNQTKWVLFEDWFQQELPTTPQMTLGPHDDVEEILGRCYHAVHLQKNHAAASEKRLLALVDCVSHFISSLCNVVLDSSYVQRATRLVDDNNRLVETSSFGRTLGLDVPSWNSSLIVSKGLTAAGLLGLDLAEWKLAGVSQSIPHAIANQIVPGGAFWLKSFEKLGIGDELVVAQFLPWMRNSIQFSLFVGLGSYMSSRSISEMSLVYCLALAIGACAIRCVALFYKVMYGEQNCPTQSFFQNLAGWVAFPLTMKYAIPPLLHLWNARNLTTDLLLSDKDVCQTYPEECRREACALLGVSENASPEEIKAAYKKIATQTHPDLSQGSGLPSIRHVNSAKAICFSPFKSQENLT